MTTRSRKRFRKQWPGLDPASYWYRCGVSKEQLASHRFLLQVLDHDYFRRNVELSPGLVKNYGAGYCEVRKMSRAVQSQADVGMLSLQGLSAFGSILGILSADNVSPMALIQMQSLGAMLPTNGDYAEKAKTLLQRCSDNRLNHLGLAIGWRKNDSASLMAESAGGQAAALLSMCLGNLFKPEHYAQILSHLCWTLLPKSMQVSSVLQLADAAKLLAAKLNALGFGNLLACEVTKIHRVYASLGEAAPKVLLEDLSAETAIELLEGISRALREDEIICRISGVQGMGHILGLLQALCPRSTSVTVEGVLIQDTQDRKVIADFLKQEYETEPVKIHLESMISTSAHIELPIVRSNAYEDYSSKPYARCPEIYRFQWSGWLADWLQLAFLRHGLSCDQDILDACCDLLWFELELTQTRSTTRKEGAAKIPPVTLSVLLGPFCAPRVFIVCKTIRRATPRRQTSNWIESFNRLVAVVRRATESQICTCEEANKCDWSTGWSSTGCTREHHRYQRSKCVIYDIWYSIRDTLYNGLFAFFTEPGQNATASIALPSAEAVPLLEDGMFTQQSSRSISIKTLYAAIMQSGISSREALSSIALSLGSCTIYPAVLESLSVPTSRSVIFRLVDGHIVFAGHYYWTLLALRHTSRLPAKRSLTTGDIRPSHIGVEPNFLQVTVRESLESLTVLCRVQYAGNIKDVDLIRAIHGYMVMKWANPCDHPVDDFLNTSKYKAMATSVAWPAAENAIGVAMTRWNPAAQFLCCENENHLAVLQKDCCLNCALKDIELSSDPKLVVIVG